MRRKRCFSLLLLLALLAVPFFSPTASPQTQRGSIEGRVVDGTGAVLPGVTVTLDSPVLLSPQTTATDSSGRYVFPNLVPGAYDLTFALDGFQTVRHEGLVVSVGRTLTIDTTLQVAGVAETVTVIGETPAVDVTSTNVAVNLDQGFLQEVPTSRDVWSILQTQAPQVVLDREDVGGSEGGLQAVFSVRGTTWHQNTYSLNGVNVTDPAATGASGFYYDYDSFEEVQISTGSHSAEVATPGVYYNLVSKTGTDAFRGGLSYYYENDSLVSDNIDQELRDAGVETGSSISLFSDFTAQFGGPIIEDRLRFYTSWRDWRIHRDVVNFPLSEDTDLFSGLGNVTYQINPRNQITGFYTFQTYLKPRRNASATVLPEATWIEDDVFQIAQGAWHSNLSDNALLDARVSYLHVDFPLQPQADATEAGNIDLGTGVWSRAAPGYFAQLRDRLSLNGALTYFQSGWGGDHELKFGLEYQNAGQEAETTYVRDLLTFTVDGTPAFVDFYNTPFVAEQRFYEVNAFGQDSWRVGDQLTVNLGARFSGVRGFLPEQGAPAGAFFPARQFDRQDVISWNNVAPRLGVVYDILGDGRYAAKAAYGRYYHQISTGFIDTVNQNGQADRFHIWNDANGDGIFQLGEQGALLSVSGGVNNQVDPDLAQPHTDELVIGLESELPRRIRLAANFTYRRKTDLIALVNVGVPDDLGYTPVTALDPGRDGVAGTADDREITVFNQREEFLGEDLFLETNPEGFDGDFRGLELVFQKRFVDRWQLLGSYALSKSTLERTSIDISAFGGEEEGAGGVGFGSGTGAYVTPNSGINQSGEEDFFDRTHIVKLVGTYQIPGIDATIAGVFKHQTGTPYGRILTLTEDIDGNPFNQGNISIFAEPRGTFRFPAIRTFDFRASKFFDFGRQRIEAIVDVFNLTNSNAITNLNPNTSVFRDPTGVLGPRVVRFGARWTF